MSKELTTQEHNFIQNLYENGGHIANAARDAGYAPDYGYALKRRLAKEIVNAAKDYIAVHTVKAAIHMVNAIDAENPNPVQLNAAKEVLDRGGVARKDDTPTVTIRPNIFILPEKRPITIIDQIENE